MHQMTTAALQQRHRSIYDQFYREHDLVLSLPLQFRRVHDTPMGCDSLLIKQQLPTNIYLWLTPKKRPGVFFSTATVYSNHDGFLEESIEGMIWKKKLLLLREKVQEYLLSDGYAGWFTCDLLSEQIQWYGFGFIWILCTSLACATFLLAGKVSREQLQDTHFSDTQLYKDLVNRSIELDIATWWSPSGISAHLALQQHAQPVVQFGSASSVTLAGTTPSPNEHNVILPLSELFDREGSLSMPIDYGVISLW